MTGKHRRASSLFAVVFSMLMILSAGVPPVVASAGTPTPAADGPLATGAATTDDRAPVRADTAFSPAMEDTASATGFSTANETIATCTVIDSNGTYRVTQNITAPADGPCIFINASDVVLNGNGHSIKANGSGDNDGFPIAVKDSKRVSDSPQGDLTNVTIRNVRVSGWPKPVLFARVSNTTVDDIVIENGSEVGLRYVKGSSHLLTDSLIVNTDGGNGIKVTGARNGRIVRTTVSNNYYQGINVESSENYTVTRTTIEGSGVQGLLLSEGSNHTIRNNTIVGNSHDGIQLYNTDGSLVANNTVRSNGHHGLYFVDSKRNRLVNNTVAANNRFGIRVRSRWRGSDNNTLVQNTFRRNDRGGILLSGAKRTDVHNNIIRQNGWDGIFVWGAAHSLVRDNTVTGNDNGVTLNNVDNVTVKGNVLTNNSQRGLRLHHTVTRFRVASNIIRNNSVGVGIPRLLKSGTIERNRIVDNTNAGIRLSTRSADLITIRRNVIARNGEYGINNGDDDVVVDAENNWWGDASGPSSHSGASQNLTDPFTGAIANGSGDAVSENDSKAGVSNVHFDPWLGTAPTVGGEEFRIATAGLVRSKLGDPITHRIETRGGSRPITSFEVVNGALPPGMELHDDGTLNGTPTAAGNFTFRIRVTDSDNATANKTFTKQVSATVPSPVIKVEKGSGGVMPGGTQLYLIEVKNTGSTIARNVSTTEYLEPWFTFVDASGPYNHTTEVLINGSRFGVDGNYSRGLITWNTSRLDPGESILLTYQVRLSERFPVGGTVRGEACSCDEGCQEFKSCRKRVAGGCKIPSGLSTIAAVLSGNVAGAIAGAAGAPGPAGSLCKVLGTGAICSRTARASDVFSRAPGGPPGNPCDATNTTVKGASDPNEKVVATDRFIQPNQTLPYAVHFENVGNASARNVTVTDRLSTNLNLSTVTVFTANGTPLSLEPNETVTLLRRNKTLTRNATIDNTTVTRNETVTEHYTATLQGRTLRWHLENIYLPPNATGKLLLTIDPDQGLPDGTHIDNNATIRFDEVSSLTTNDTVNIIDSVSPTCRVQPLPDQSPQAVTLTWTGSDPVGQIEGVTIFHSTDGETWDIARIGVKQHNVTVSTLTSNLGQTHRFMCIAEDTAGNRETQTPSAEATTTTVTVDVTGTVRKSDGGSAANDTITIGDSSRSRYTAAIFTAGDSAGDSIVAGLNYMRTDQNGGFSTTTDVKISKDLAYYQAHPAHFLHVTGTPPTGSTAFPRDGSPDLYGLDRFTLSNDSDLGTVSLPSAHVVNVTIITENGVPVENATIQFDHIGPDGARATVVFPNATNGNGVFVPQGSDRPGLELTGSVTISVRPPIDDRKFADLIVVRNLTVDSDRDVTIRLDLKGEASEDNEPPVVDAGPDATIDEGVALNRTGSITDPDSTDWTGTVTYGDGTDLVPLSIDGTAFELEHTYVEDGDYTVNVTVSDGAANGTNIVNVTVVNVAPKVTASGDSTKEGSSANVSATFTDPGVTDTHNASIDWGDGNSIDVPVDQDAGEGSLSAEHVYLDNGKYAAAVTVTDDEGGSGNDTAPVMVKNVAPNLSVTVDDPVDEGSPLTLTATIDDPGVLDTHNLTIMWGDGNTTTVTVDQRAETSTVTVQHTYLDSGTYDVSVIVTDDDGGEDSTTTTATVENVPPSVSTSGDTINEGENATITAEFTDPGLMDTHTVVVDWGDGTTEQVTITQRRGGGSLSASHTYGDNGTYQVTVTVTDDDGGTGEATADVTIRNLAPSVGLNTTGIVALAEVDAFLGRTGQPQNHTATAIDPGSDDLIVAWTNGPTTTYFNDGSGPDPPQSPGGTFPFAVTDTGTVTFAAPGIYDLVVTVTDDDGASTADSATKVVTGEGDHARGMGFWRHQYSGKGKAHHTDANLSAFLNVTDVGSAVFHEEVAAGSFDAAHEVLKTSGPSMRDKAEAQALAAWLNFVSGRVGWTEQIDTDGDGIGDRAFHDVIGEVETILQDDNATEQELERAKDLAEAINTQDDGDDDSAGDAGGGKDYGGSGKNDQGGNKGNGNS